MPDEPAVRAIEYHFMRCNQRGILVPMYQE